MIKMAGSALLLALVTGCPYTYLASPETDPKTAEWEAFIRENYPDYTPPPRRAKNIVQPEAVPAAVEEESAVTSDLPAPEQLPAEAETEKNDAVAEIPESAEEAEKTAADTANAEEKTAEEAVTEVKPDAEKAEVKENAETAEVKPDAEKTAGKTEEKTVVPDADPATPPDPTNSTVYEVKSGDTLGAIAQKMYGNASFSNVIHKANMDILKDPDKLKIGMKLIIPKL